MISTAHIPFINKKPTEVFSTKFIVAPKRLNDEFSCVNTEHLPTTSQKEKSTNNTDDKIKKNINHPPNYTLFFYTLWGIFQFISGGLFDWYMHQNSPTPARINVPPLHQRGAKKIRRGLTPLSYSTR